MIAAESGKRREEARAAGCGRTAHSSPKLRALLAALLAALIWLPRLALDRFVTADEHAWLARSGNFYRALAQGDFAAAFQRHHPGVTVTGRG